MADFSRKMEWPAGHRAALSIIVHVPGFRFSEDGTSQEELLGLDYTQTGLKKIFESLDDLDIQATFAFTSDSITDGPDFMRNAHDREHEVAASFCSASGATDDLVTGIQEEINEPVNGIVARIPGFPSSELDHAWGSDSGRSWIIDGRSGDVPVLQRDPDAALIPTSPYLMDTTWLSPVRPLPPSSLLETWMVSLDAHREEGTFMPLIVHPHIMGRPGFLGTLVRFLDDVIAYGDVWIARTDHIAATWHTYFAEE